MEQEPKSAGRPSSFTQEIADAMLARLSVGESLRSICEEDGFPSKVTVLHWLSANIEFRTQYSHAKELAAEAIAEELFEISDDGRNDWMQRLAFKGALPSWEPCGEHINRSRLRVDTRKWYLSKIMPKKYGDKVQQEVSGPDGGAVPINLVRVEFVKPKE